MMKIKIIFNESKTTLNESKIIKKPGLRHRSRPGVPKIIVIHHAETRSPRITYDTLKAKKISTHYEVDKNGTIYEYVDPSDVAYHAIQWNDVSIGIDITGHGGQETSAQKASLLSLVTRLCNAFSIPQVVAPDGDKYKNIDELVELGIGIVRHRNLRNTSCPGDLDVEMLGDTPDVPLEADLTQTDLRDIRLKKSFLPKPSDTTKERVFK
jgi:hypothetical protein